VLAILLVLGAALVLGAREERAAITEPKLSLAAD
jgi:hypothetical protein